MQPLKIGIERLKIRTSVGIYTGEKKKKQYIFVSAELFFSESRCDVDEMQYSVDYDVLSNEIRRIAALRHYELIENLALNTAHALKKTAACSRVIVRIDKPLAARKNHAETIWVSIEV